MDDTRKCRFASIFNCSAENESCPIGSVYTVGAMISMGIRSSDYPLEDCPMKSKEEENT